MNYAELRHYLRTKNYRSFVFIVTNFAGITSIYMMLNTDIFIIEIMSKISLQCINLTKPECLTDVTRAFLKINREI